MYFALMGKLSARRQNLSQDKDKGFTLIELLVVVIIIGILAAIAIPVYLGVQNNAKDSGVKSDVTNLKTALISQMTSTGVAPVAGVYDTTAKLAGDLADGGATLGSDTKSLTVSVSTDKKNFCIEGLSTTTKKFGATETAGVVEGACAAGIFTKKS
jgi:type IV pilus assembly protein PilA